MNALIIFKKYFRDIDFVIEYIGDMYGPDNVEIIKSPWKFYFKNKRPDDYDQIILLEPGLVHLLMANIFLPAKNIAIMNRELRWYETEGNKWSSIIMEIRKEIVFFKIFFKSLFCKLFSLLT